MTDGAVGYLAFGGGRMSMGSRGGDTTVDMVAAIYMTPMIYSSAQECKNGYELETP